ncbi:MAG: M3 family metallopeptidase, partial [Chloroflexota bacterium]|nr:M3 family metallopeptidase [Chloroflexota bacterium]
LQNCYGGVVDMHLHDERDVKDLDAIYREAWAITLVPFHEGVFRLAGWGHIMGGYDAGYYGYLWAQVYGDDMFSRFESEGPMSADVGAAYRREVLETAGSRPAIDRVRGFLRREPSNEAFLRNIGLGKT